MLTTGITTLPTNIWLVIANLLLPVAFIIVWFPE
jgi:hypothetical protein